MGAHVLDGEQFLFRDRLDDGALADAVAAADFGGVGHQRGFVLAGVAALALLRLAEHQPVAHLADVGAFAQKLEIPGAVAGVAVKHGAEDLVVVQHQALVDAGAGVVEHDLLAVRAMGEIAGGEQVDAGDFELG